LSASFPDFFFAQPKYRGGEWDPSEKWGQVLVQPLKLPILQVKVLNLTLLRLYSTRPLLQFSTGLLGLLDCKTWPHLPPRQMRHRVRELVEEIVGRICREQGLSEGELQSGSQRKMVSEVRAQIAFFLSRGRDLDGWNREKLGRWSFSHYHGRKEKDSPDGQ
jgi:hypothetical protein